MDPQFDAAPLHALYAASPMDNFSLGYALRQSAHAIEQGKHLLAVRARELARAIEERRGGELTLAAHSARLLIALLWAYLAFRLDREWLSAMALGSGLTGGMSVATAQALSRIFMILAGLGLLAAVLGGFLVMGTGRGGNTLLRRKSAALGAEAATIAATFDDSLDRLRAAMDGRDPRSGEAVEDLSRMHLVALEATAFFHDVQFLTDPNRADAAAKFRGYLRGRSQGAAAEPGVFDVALPLLLGVILGIGYGYVRWAAPASAPVEPVSAGIPLWTLVATIGLAALYALLGRLFDFIGGALTAGAAGQARDEALDALRAAFVAGNPPRLDDVIRRIEDALAVYKARLAGRETAHHAANEAEPAWRSAPEGPRFVAQTFDAAPPLFRADRQAPKRKIFSGKGDRHAAPKQALTGHETPPWLNE